MAYVSVMERLFLWLERLRLDQIMRPQHLLYRLKNPGKPRKVVSLCTICVLPPNVKSERKYKKNIGRFQKISIRIPLMAFRISEGEGGVYITQSVYNNTLNTLNTLNTVCKIY